RRFALKCILPTSGCKRISEEIRLLRSLSKARGIAPLLRAFRYQDQVVLVLPYIRHTEFRSFFSTCDVQEIQYYMFALFSALESVHKLGILHRDVKPTNFLYDTSTHRGFLVDFGLAQIAPRKEGPRTAGQRQMRLTGSTPVSSAGHHGYPISDARPAIRAARAGTRGFRPPEVLIKVVHQTIAVDIWAAGVVLLCFLSGRYPFFNANTDDASLLEIAQIVGRNELTRFAQNYGRTFHTNIPMRNEPKQWSRLCKQLNPNRAHIFTPEAFDLLQCALTVDPAKRITAAEALQHPFLRDVTPP
ncbi:kinase-like domain-containing protein, partial [Thamnocephalis sphaerospora]